MPHSSGRTRGGLSNVGPTAGTADMEALNKLSSYGNDQDTS